MPLTEELQWDAELEVDVLLANRGPVDAVFPLSETLRAQLSAEGDSWPITLTRESNGSVPEPVPPGGFVAVRYHGTLPAQAHGRAVLELDEPGVEHARAIIDIIGDGSTGAWNGDYDHLRLLGGRLSIHRPIYFITGALSPPGKFQVSFKYRLLSFGEDSGPSPAHSLQIAYTQRSLWSFGPFYDTSYMPEILYQWTPPRDQAPSAGGFTWLGLQSGLLHESNGRSPSSEERQSNILYVRPMFSIGVPEGWHAELEPQVWVYVFGLRHNPDLYIYRGNSALTLTVGKGNGPSVAITLLPGGHFTKGSRQVDFSIPVHLPFIGFSTYVLVQYFEGYAEALITYQQHTSALRAGIEVVR